MSIISYPRPPFRSIAVRGSADRWQGQYAGDPWTNEFQTEIGELWLVLDALNTNAGRRGLPVVIHQNLDEAVA